MKNDVVPVKAESQSTTAIRERLDAVDRGLYAIYTECVNLENEGNARTAQAWYDIAVQFLLASKLSRYAVDALGRALGYSAARISDLTLIAARISNDDLLYFLGRRTPAGRALSGSHLKLAATVADSGERRRILDAAADNAWTVDVMEAEIRALSGNKFFGGSRAGAGRKLVVPATPNAMVRALEQRAGVFSKFLDEVVAPHLKSVIGGEAGKTVDDALLSRLVAERASLEVIAAESAKAADLIGELVDELSDAPASRVVDLDAVADESLASLREDRMLTEATASAALVALYERRVDSPVDPNLAEAETLFGGGES